MIDFIIGVFILIGMALRATWAMLGWVFNSLTAEKTKQNSSPAIGQKPQEAKEKVERSGPKESAKAQSGATVIPVSPQLQSFEAADRITTIRLNPDVGVIHLRFYMKRQTLERSLTITEPRLQRLMGGRSHELDALPCKSLSEMDAARNVSVHDAAELINSKGKASQPAVNAKAAQQANAKSELVVKAPTPAHSASAQAVSPDGPTASLTVALPVKDTMKDEPPRRQWAERPSYAAPQPSQEANQRPAQANPEKVKLTEAPSALVFEPKIEVGCKYVGTLVSAQHKWVKRRTGGYETFEAIIQLDNGAVLPLRGAELEREIDSNGIIEGNRIAVTSMGKAPVTLREGKMGSKNLYQVAKL